ncbi:diguanylate cyclase [Neptunicella sp. SCSIO 80796]|uniref:diguanylate cyclase n=1 Tax=Neptunicella plasticusilytica TaxID=3117012 RepID=UPI003A4E3883
MSENTFLDSAKDLSQAKILVVDDQSINTEFLCGILEDDYLVIVANSGRDAIRLCNEMVPDLVILDVVMPELDGLETCRILKSEANTRDIPIIFVTAVSDQDSENDCWEAGGIDFLNKPVNPLTLHHRVRAQLTIKLQSDLLRDLAYMDGLTHIYNRRYFEDYYSKQLAHADRNSEDLSILLIDIDFFKQYNDKYGHLEGDHCLKSVATALKSVLMRPLDIVVRYGGEEFICVLPATGIDAARTMAQKIQGAIKELNIPHFASDTRRLTISIGIACYRRGQENAEALINRADKLLYQAKSEGRNRFCS